MSGASQYPEQSVAAAADASDAAIEGVDQFVVGQSSQDGPTPAGSRGGGEISEVQMVELTAGGDADVVERGQQFAVAVAESGVEVLD